VDCCIRKARTAGEFNAHKWTLVKQEINLVHYWTKLPVQMSARSKARAVFDRSNTGIVGSNPARCMDVCSHFSVLCCSV
jgi:hypothetical protein